MKTKSIIALVLFGTSSAFAQNTFPTTGNSAGIGTLTPTVFENYSSLTINNSNAGGYGGLLDLQRNKVSKALILADDAGLNVMGMAGIPVRFWADNAEHMRILTNGRVGIGHTTPRARLEVAPPPGDGPAGLFRLNGAQAWGHVLTLSTDGAAGDDPRLLFNYRAGAKQWALGGHVASTRFSLWEDAGDGIFGSGFGTERLTVLSGGNVGIGIANPAEKLAVNGNIHAREVKIELIGWPDYVFKPNYYLRPLPELKQFIDKNHHLPEIPDEGTVLRDGIKLGEMNKLLLKKIEELTLYLIEKENQLKTEQRINKQQEKRLDQLEKLLRSGKK